MSLAPALWIVAVVAIVFLLRAATQLLIPIVLAVLVSYALEPVVAWLARRHVPRIAGAAVLLAAILGVLGWGVYSLRDDALQAVETLPEVARRARELVWSRSASGPGGHVRQAAQVLQGSSPDSSEPRPQGSSQQDRPPQAESGSAPQQSPGVRSVSGLVQSAVGSVLALAGHLTVIVFLVFFLLVSGGHFRKRFIEVAGPHLKQRRITETIIDDINAQIQRFLLVRLVTAVVVGLATWAVLAWMGVAQSALWAILAAVFNSIPYFGPVIVSGGLLVVGLVQDGDPMRALQMSGAALAITSLEGWLLTPLLMGKAERMHVVVVFLGVLLWTWIWGAWGTILAVPMLVVVKSIADHVEPLKPVGRLMAP
jgi:predicted PurR-regulated permease PerM